VSRQSCTTLFGLFVFFFALHGGHARTWSSDTGDTVDGTYAGVEDEKALIVRDSDGGTTRIKLTRLSQDDRDYVSKVEDLAERVQSGNARTPSVPASVGSEDGVRLLGKGISILTGLIAGSIFRVICAVIVGVLYGTLIVYLAGKLMMKGAPVSDAVKASVLMLLYNVICAVIIGAVVLIGDRAMANTTGFFLVPVAGVLALWQGYEEGFFTALGHFLLWVIFLMLPFFIIAWLLGASLDNGDTAFRFSVRATHAVFLGTFDDPACHLLSGDFC
jgi:hypothetical protein